MALPKPSPAVVAPKKAVESKLRPSANPAEFQIVLDAGHGGWDLGTVGRKGLLEKDLVLDIVQRLGKLIETKLGAQVIYTRQDDSYLPLEKRAEIANVAKADMFLSVHANYSDLASARGVETYYTTTYSSIRARTEDDDSSLKDVDWTGVDIRSKVTDSHHLAADIQQSLFGGLAANNPEIRNRGVKEAQYVVLTGTQMPAVLAEVSFVSSPADETRLENSAYRQQIAEALYRGVAQYHREITHTKLASAKKSPAPLDNSVILSEVTLREAEQLRSRRTPRSPPDHGRVREFSRSRDLNQLPSPGNKRPVRNLPLKPLRPPPRHRPPAFRTTSSRRHPILLHKIPTPPNQHPSAPAPRILQISQPAPANSPHRRNRSPALFPISAARIKSSARVSAGSDIL